MIESSQASGCGFPHDRGVMLRTYRGTEESSGRILMHPNCRGKVTAMTGKIENEWGHTLICDGGRYAANVPNGVVFRIGGLPGKPYYRSIAGTAKAVRRRSSWKAGKSLTTRRTRSPSVLWKSRFARSERTSPHHFVRNERPPITCGDSPFPALVLPARRRE